MAPIVDITSDYLNSKLLQIDGTLQSRPQTPKNDGLWTITGVAVAVTYLFTGTYLSSFK